MPIYDYSCTACGHLIEVIHGIAAPGPRFCSQCGAEGSMRKIVTAPAFHFKGSGWAKKDRAATAQKATTDHPEGPDASGGGRTKEPTDGAAKESPDPAPVPKVDEAKKASTATTGATDAGGT